MDGGQQEQAEQPGQSAPLAPPLVESQRAIEAILLVAAEPTPAQLLAQLLEVPVEVVEQLCRRLAERYRQQGHGFQLVEVAGGWRYQTDPDLAPYVERFAMDGHSARLSSAALETLAIVAYKQPISRAQVSAIRGVNVDGVLRTLVQRGYVEEIGRDSGPGQAVLFGTTSAFLERVGLRALDELPALGDFVPSAEVVEALEQTLRVDPGDDAPPPPGPHES
jgi:segregation and condensation protein B